IEFTKKLGDHLRALIDRFELNHVLGTDLATSLLAPTCALYAQHDVVLENGTTLSVRGLLDRLPQLMQALELEGVLSSPALQSDPGLNALVCRAIDIQSGDEVDRTLIEWIRDARLGAAGTSALRAGADYALHLLDGQSTNADAVWSTLP